MHVDVRRVFAIQHGVSGDDLELAKSPAARPEPIEQQVASLPMKVAAHEENLRQLTPLDREGPPIIKVDSSRDHDPYRWSNPVVAFKGIPRPGRPRGQRGAVFENAGVPSVFH